MPTSLFPLLWLALATYATGLFASHFWAALRHVPVASISTLFAASHFVFGGTMLIQLIALMGAGYAMAHREPVKEAKQWYVARGLPSSRLRPVHLCIRWASTVLTYILPYFLVLAALSFAMHIGRPDVHIVYAFSALSVAFLFRFFFVGLEEDKWAQEKDLLGKFTSVMFGISGDAESQYRSILPIAWILLLMGVVSYPGVPMALGGGRTAAVVIVIKDDFKSAIAANRFGSALAVDSMLDGSLPVEMYYRSSEFIGVRSTDRSKHEHYRGILIPQAGVVGIVPLRSTVRWRRRGQRSEAELAPDTSVVGSPLDSATGPVAPDTTSLEL